MKIVMVGGGTGGTVTPLLAVAQEVRLRQPDAEVVFYGTKHGPERGLAEAAGWPFITIPAGKLRRYAHWKNFSDPFLVLAGFFKAYSRLRQWQPDAVFSAGSFVAVPVVWAAKLLGIPTLVHQQDVVPSLANKLVTGAATRITVTFENSLKDFPKDKTVWTGNPIREELLHGDRVQARSVFGLRDSLPTVLVFGGGTGAAKINELMAGASYRLVQSAQVIHLFGRHKVLFTFKHENYHTFEFLTQDMKEAYAAADIVVCRAGLNALTELAALGKPAILIPIPGTHQEANAQLFKRMNAAVVLDQLSIDSDFVANVIMGLLANKQWQDVLSHNIRQLVREDARERLADQLLQLIHKQ